MIVMENGIENRPKTAFERKLERRWYAHRLANEKDDELIKLRHSRHGRATMLNKEVIWKVIDDGVSSSIRYDDIPWLGLDDAPTFLAELGIGGDQRKVAIRKALLRWHPDSFIQKYGSRLHVDDYEKIIKKITATFQTIMSAVREQDTTI